MLAAAFLFFLSTPLFAYCQSCKDSRMRTAAPGQLSTKGIAQHLSRGAHLSKCKPQPGDKEDNPHRCCCEFPRSMLCWLQHSHWKQHQRHSSVGRLLQQSGTWRKALSGPKRARTTCSLLLIPNIFRAHTFEQDWFSGRRMPSWQARGWNHCPPGSFLSLCSHPCSRAVGHHILP